VYIFISLVLPFNIFGITRLFYILKEEHNESKVHYNLLDFKGFKFFKFGWIFKKRIVVTGLFIFFIILGFFNVKMKLNYSTKIEKPQITAHRGASLQAPENTISSIELAIENKSDYAEIDVQETKDGVLVVTHDRNISRFTGIDIDVSLINYADLQKLDFGSWFDKKYAEEKIPTLEEVIDVSYDKIKLNIELKGDGASKSFVENVVKLIQTKNYKDQCIVTSLDLDKLKKVRSLDKNIKIGYIIFLLAGDYNRIDVDAFCVETSILTQDFIIKAHESGKEVWVWTPNTIEDIEKKLILGVDNIITDEAKLVDKVYQEKIKEDRLDSILDRIFFYE